ncbi:hypothetical protein D3C81_906950 [compost metagenome]
MPDNIFARQVQHLGVDSLDRQRFGFHHKRRVAQCGIKGVVFNIHQPAHFRQRRNIQPRFGDKCQRPFGTGQNACQIEGLQVIAEHMAQIVAGQEAVKLGEFFQDQPALVAATVEHLVIDAAFNRIFVGNRFRQRRRHGSGVNHIATQQHRPQAQYVVGSFSVDQRSLTGGVGVNHAAERSAVTGGKLR